MNKMLGIALLGAAALTLAACGSSGGDDAPAPAPVVTSEIPGSATQNAAGLLAFANQQVGSTSETAEPLVVGDATLPLDDTTETSL